MTNAREFADEIADIIRSKGREVTVTETEEEWGRFVWLSALAPKWYDRTINLSARYDNRTKRWALGKLTVRLISSDKPVVRSTRTDIRIAADVYA